MSNTEKAAQLARRKRKRGSIYVPIAVILTAAAILAGMIIFFKVAAVEVSGVKTYTEEEVIAASGVGRGQNIFFLDKNDAADKIYAQLPYIDDINIVKRLPETVIIEVSECYRLATVESGGSFWIINKKGKILEETNSSADTIVIHGLEPVEPEIGKTLALGDTGATQLASMTEVLSAIVELGIKDDIDWLDMSNIGSITLSYKDRFDVELGNSENAEIKLHMLVGVVENLQDTDTGRIDVSVENEAHFMPD